MDLLVLDKALSILCRVKCLVGSWLKPQSSSIVVALGRRPFVTAIAGSNLAHAMRGVGDDSLCRLFDLHLLP